MRSLAVVPVILFHAGFAAFGGGFVGVDVFFVISGYLITSIILAELQAGRFSLLTFYERRARRILPALFFMLAVVSPLAWLWLMPQVLKEFAQSLIAVVTFCSNVLFWRQSGYFDTAAEMKPLLHTWSLAVEEQFYILFPLLLMAAWRWRRRWLLGLLALAFVASLGVATWGAYYKPSASFFLLPTRGWELLIGAFTAFHLARSGSTAYPPAAGQALSLVGLGLLLYAIFAFDQSTPFPGHYALVPTVGTALLILFAQDGTLVKRILSSRWMVGIGLISFSAYLWHQPLLAFAKHGSAEPPSAWLMGLLCALTLPLAYASWRFVEKPFRQRGTIRRGTVFASAAAGAAVLAGVGLAGQLNHGFEQSFVERRLAPAEQEVYRLIQRHTEYDLYDHMVDDGACVFWARAPGDAFAQRFAACAQRLGKALVVVGDSHAMNLFNIAAKSGVGPFVVGVAQGECRPQDDKPTCHYTAFEAFARQHAAAIETILFHQSGAYFIADRHGRVDSALAFEPGQPYRFNAGDIGRALKYVARLDTIAPTVWVGPFMEARVELLRRGMLGGDRFAINPRSLELFPRLDDAIRQQVAGSGSLPPANYLPFSRIRAIEPDFLRVGACLTYRDVDHFSLCGEDILAADFRRFFSGWAGPGTAPPHL